MLFVLGFSIFVLKFLQYYGFIWYIFIQFVNASCLTYSVVKVERKKRVRWADTPAGQQGQQGEQQQQQQQQQGIDFHVYSFGKSNISWEPFNAGFLFLVVCDIYNMSGWSVRMGYTMASQRWAAVYLIHIYTYLQ